MTEPRPGLLHPEYFEQPHAAVSSADMWPWLEAPEMWWNKSDVADARISLTAAVVSYHDSPQRVRRIFEDIHRQDFPHDVQTVFIDGGNDNATLDIAHQYVADRDIVTVSPGPGFRADVLNAAMERASNNLVYTTIGHAALSNDQVFNTGVGSLLKDSTAGVYGVALPDDNASRIEHIGANRLGARRQIAMGAVAVSKGMGLMAADSAFWRKDMVQDLGGFDTRYGSGGADGQMGQALAKAGAVIRHPLLSFHHTHGFGYVDAARQLRVWMRSAKPRDYRPAEFSWHPNAGL